MRPNLPLLLIRLPSGSYSTRTIDSMPLASAMATTTLKMTLSPSSWSQVGVERAPVNEFAPDFYTLMLPTCHRRIRRFL